MITLRKAPPVSPREPYLVIQGDTASVGLHGSVAVVAGDMDPPVVVHLNEPNTSAERFLCKFRDDIERWNEPKLACLGLRAFEPRVEI